MVKQLFFSSKIQGKVVEIASLQEVFTDKVLEQVC